MYFKEPFDKEKIVKQHEELLNIFKEDLSNLSDKTIKKHVQNVDFFINEYLLDGVIMVVVLNQMTQVIMKNLTYQLILLVIVKKQMCLDAFRDAYYAVLDINK